MSVDSWKSLFDLVAVAAALITFIAGAGALISGRVINKRQGDQIRMFGRSLRDKDVKIAEANRSIQAIRTKGEIEAKRIETEGKERIAEVETAASIKITEAQRSLESEKLKRIELAVSLLPRHFRDQSGAIASLRAFPARAALIEYLNDSECLATAEQINAVLAQLRWKTTGLPVKTVWPSEGIGVSTGRVSLPDEGADIRRTTELSGQILVRELNKSGISATWLIGSRLHRLPFGTLYISVGIRPNIALENVLKELGPEDPPTPLGERGTMMGGNRQSFLGLP